MAALVLIRGGSALVCFNFIGLMLICSGSNLSRLQKHLRFVLLPNILLTAIHQIEVRVRIESIVYVLQDYFRLTLVHEGEGLWLVIFLAGSLLEVV